MTFVKRGFKKQKSGYIRIGGMFKGDPQFLHENATFSYQTTTDGKYLEPVVELLNKIYDAGGVAKFSLTKWNDQDNPVLSVSEAKPKAAAPSKRIGRGGPAVAEQVEAQEDPGL